MPAQAQGGLRGAGDRHLGFPRAHQIRGLRRGRAFFAVDRHLVVARRGRAYGKADGRVFVKKIRIGQVAHRAPDQPGLLDRAHRNGPVRRRERLPPTQDGFTFFFPSASEQEITVFHA